jgi:hypothetical protein
MASPTNVASAPAATVLDGKRYDIVHDDEEVWTTVIYCSNPKREDWMKLYSINYKYLIVRTLSATWGENLVAYMQFNRKVSGKYLKEMLPRFKCKRQCYSNMATINYVKNFKPNLTMKDATEFRKPYDLHERKQAEVPPQNDLQESEIRISIKR